MKIAILTNDQPNQVALCNKLAERFEVSAIVISNNVPKRKTKFSKRFRLKFNALAGKLFAPEFKRTWFELLEQYHELYPELPSSKAVYVRNVNDPETVSTIESSGADLVVVSGTNLVGRKVIAAAKKRGGIVNLHTGISPYVKGGPNCTNWCLAKGWFHLIGNTVMWLDLGIDTGSLIATEKTPLDGSEDLLDLHWKVLEHAHDLYVRSIAKFEESGPVPGVSQDSIAGENTFYSVQWGLKPMRAALENFSGPYREYFEKLERSTADLDGIKLVPLEGK